MTCRMIFLMSNTSPYGPALMAFVYDEIAALGLSPTAWAGEHGMNISNMGKWRDGTTPSVETVQRLADGLGYPVIELLAAMVGLDREAKYAPSERPPISVETAIELDPTLTEGMRISLRGLIQGFREVAAQGTAVTSRD